MEVDWSSEIVCVWFGCDSQLQKPNYFFQTLVESPLSNYRVKKGSPQCIMNSSVEPMGQVLLFFCG